MSSLFLARSCSASAQSYRVADGRKPIHRLAVNGLLGSNVSATMPSLHRGRTLDFHRSRRASFCLLFYTSPFVLVKLYKWSPAHLLVDCHGLAGGPLPGELGGLKQPSLTHSHDIAPLTLLGHQAERPHISRSAFGSLGTVVPVITPDRLEPPQCTLYHHASGLPTRAGSYPVPLPNRLQEKPAQPHEPCIWAACA